MNIFLIHSFYAHLINGILILCSIVILYNNYSKILRLDPYKLLILILLFSLVISMHGLSHLGLERVYGFNPILLL
jgi:hypothetical protein